MQANLLDVLGDNNSPKLTYTFHRHRSATSETRLRAEIKALIDHYTVDLDGFIRCFREWMETTSVGNSFTFWSYYKQIQITGGVEVWHLNADGDPDGLVCTITKKEVRHA